MELGGRNGTNSVTNWMLSGTKGQPVPEVGMGATILAWTDRYAGTITKVVEIKGGFELTVQEDGYKRVDSNGMSEMQTYEYTPDLYGMETVFRFEAKKASKGWRQVWTKPETGRVCFVEGGYGLRIGSRQKYNDFSF